MGKEVSITEKERMTDLELALTVLHWGVRKSARYLAYHCKRITLYVRSTE